MNKRRWIIFSTLIFMFFFITPLSVHATDTVYYGKYVQQKVTDKREIAFVEKHNLEENQYIDGVRYIPADDGNYYKDAPIEWYVIKDNGDSYILLSKYILTFEVFTDQVTGSHFWNDSVMRDFLNTTFKDRAFSSEQQKYFKTMTLSTEECTYEDVYIEEKADPYQKITTEDKVFLLSEDEVEEYSLSNSILKGVRTPYVKTLVDINDDWYLRGPCSWFYGSQKALIIGTDETDGQPHFYEAFGTYARGVRPCICVRKNAPELSVNYPGNLIPSSLSEITITYKANGGKNAPKAQKAVAGKTVSLSSKKPTRKNYIFKGWAIKKGGKVKYAPKASFTGKKSITLYAVWQKKPKVYILIMAGSCNTESWFSDNLLKDFGVHFTEKKSIQSAKKFYMYYKSGKKIRIDHFFEDYFEMIAPAVSTYKDTKTLKKNFKKMKLSGYQKPIVKVITSEGYFTKNQIDNAITKTYKKAKTGDLCYFAYCGHGVESYIQDDYVKPQGIAIKGKNGTTVYSYSRLINNLARSCKGKVIMFMPNCYSGGFADYARDGMYNNITVFPACDISEGTGNTAVFSSAAHKLFLGVDIELCDYVYYMKKGLDNPKKIDSGKKDHKITVKEFAAYMKKNMNKRKNHPKYWAGRNKNLVIFEY